MDLGISYVNPSFVLVFNNRGYEVEIDYLGMLSIF